MNKEEKERERERERERKKERKREKGGGMEGNEVRQKKIKKRIYK